jgi:hypothetical protein
MTGVLSQTCPALIPQERYTQKVDFAALKAELQLHEKNDLTLMKAENDRLLADVEKLKQRLREEVTRTQAGVRLDLNLEKGRIRDESSQQELKIKEVDTRIESEIAGLRTQIEQAKFSILQYLVGVATGSGALLLAYMRMMVRCSAPLGQDMELTDAEMMHVWGRSRTRLLGISMYAIYCGRGFLVVQIDTLASQADDYLGMWIVGVELSRV